MPGGPIVVADVCVKFSRGLGHSRAGDVVVDLLVYDAEAMALTMPARDASPAFLPTCSAISCLAGVAGTARTRSTETNPRSGTPGP
jgi:hypothetical protein